MQIEVRITAETFGELIQKLNAALQEMMPAAIAQATEQAAPVEKQEDVPAEAPQRRRKNIPVDKSDARAEMDHQPAGGTLSVEAAAPPPTHDEVRALAVDVARRHERRTAIVVETLLAVAGVKTIADAPGEKLPEIRDALLAL